MTSALEIAVTPSPDEQAEQSQPYLTLLPSRSRARNLVSPLPAAPDVMPQQPTARIHWIGHFVDYWHPADLYRALLGDEAHSLVVVDARFSESYALEHLPGAVNLPARDLDEKRIAELPREAEYVVYCWDDSCRASTKAANRLESMGFRVRELHGGLQAWKKQGFPTER